MVTPLVQDFIQFVGSRPRDEMIDHIGGLSPWSTCAVGEFFKSKHGRTLTMQDGFAAQLLMDLEDSNMFYIGERLNCSEVDTYGELYDMLQDEMQS